LPFSASLGRPLIGSILAIIFLFVIISEGDDEVQRRKAGDKSHQVFTELFGDDDEEEESSEEIKKKPVKSVEKADHEEGEGKKKHKKVQMKR